MCHGAQIVQPNGNELKQRKGLTLIFFATVDRLNAFRTQLSARPAKGLEFTHAQYTNPVEKPTWWKGNYGTWLTLAREVCECKTDLFNMPLRKLPLSVVLDVYIKIGRHQCRREEEGRLGDILFCPTFSFIVSAKACRCKHSLCELHRLHRLIGNSELNWERKKQSYILRLENNIAITTFLYQLVVLYSYITGEQCVHVVVAFLFNTWQMHKKKNHNSIIQHMLWETVVNILSLWFFVF